MTKLNKLIQSLLKRNFGSKRIIVSDHKVNLAAVKQLEERGYIVTIMIKGGK